MKKQKLIIIGLVSALSIGGISLMVLAHGSGDYGRYCDHKAYKGGWHHQGQGYWGHKGTRKGSAFDSLFHLEKQLGDLALNKAQREPIYAVLDEARPILRKLRQEMADNRYALMQLNLATENYPLQLNELATQQAELKKNFIVKTGEVKSKVFALLDEQQQGQFVKMQEYRRSIW